MEGWVEGKGGGEGDMVREIVGEEVGEREWLEGLGGFMVTLLWGELGGVRSEE